MRTAAADAAKAAAAPPSSSSPSSIAMKMAPGPDHQRQEPVAPDKTTPCSSSSISSSSSSSSASTVSTIVFSESESSSNTNNQETALPTLNNAALVDNKQEEPATLSTLNEGELRALLDEAITYKCPKDREGKSNLFKELLQEAEADESEEGRWTVTSGSSAGGSSRCLPGSNRSRRNKRDSVSEHLTHGGSLQNLAREPGCSSEFDGAFAYLGTYAGSSHTFAAGRRRQKRHTGPSVSARQREGGSLPSNVDTTHTLNCDLIFEEKLKKRLSEGKSVYDWTNKEKSKSLDKPSYDRYNKKEEKEKDKKENKLSGSCDIESELRDKRSSNRGKLGTNEMLESDNPPPEYNKQDCMVIGLEDFEASVISERNASAALGGVQRPRSLDAEDDEGTEMKVIDHRRPVQFITRATFDVHQTPVDSTIEFPTFREHTTKLEKSKINVNGTEGTSSLPFPTYNNVKCVMSGPSSVYSVMSWPTPNISMEAVSRLTAQHIAGKESSLSGEKKSLDENGNAVQGYNGERKKSRRKNAQEPNVIVYQAENVKGHRDDEDIDSLLSFIENKECKSKKGKTSNTVKVKTASNTKSRSRDNKDIKREQIPTKLQKCNSLEEIHSNTKLEDLTTEKSTTSSGSSSVSSQHGSINVALRRAKQRSTGDATTVDSRGDRRSWGTEEGQSIYCNDTGDDYSSRRNSVKKSNAENEGETEFHVVTNKKKKTKKQRRSSSGGRAQNLSGSGSYLQRGRGFSNDYRTPLSPALRRKSASSMPPSDKSDSSDLDSVHSLPVTSNSSKHNSSKTATSSSNAPQASYAQIARMASLNMSATPVMNISNFMPSMINTTWPSVSPKNNPESEKLPNDYYPSLDELQHSERKTRQHNFAQQSTNPSFEKPPSPTISKSKTSPENSKKTEAQEEAYSKVVKYVQDIEKMQQSQLQHESKQSSNSSSLNLNDITSTNPLPPKVPESLPSFSSQPETEHSGNSDNSKDLSANSKNSGTRIRKNHPQNSNSGSREYTTQNQMQMDESHESKKVQMHSEESTKLKNNPNQLQQDDKDAKKVSSTHNSAAGTSEDSNKSKLLNSAKLTQQFRTVIDNENARLNKNERYSKASKDQQQNNSKDNPKMYQQQSSNVRQDKPIEDTDNKKLKQSNPKPEKDQKVSEAHSTHKINITIPAAPISATSTRPAVILLDENITDQARSAESEISELTFGFEINEQLLQSEEEEEEEETPTASPDLSRFSNSPPNFNRQPIMFDKHAPRCDKFHPNFPQVPYMPVHSIPPHPVVVQTMTYVGCSMRFQTPYMLSQHPPPQVIEKCRNQPKEDFSSRYIAPDESHVQKFNHDKIVSFVGLAWDDVMRETGSASSGRVQYYSGQ